MSRKNSSGTNIQDQIKGIFTVAFAIVGGSTLLVQLARGGNRSESIDRVIYLFALVTAAYFFFSITLSRRFQIKSNLLISLIALTSIALGVIGIEQHDPINGVVLSNRLWLGFGPYVFALILIITPFIWQIYRWEIHRAWAKGLIALAATSAVALTTLSFWQDNSSVIDPDHSEYVLNEVLSIPAGNWPFDNFIPQYQTFFTFLVAPFTSSASASEITQLAFVFMFAASILALFLGIFLIRNSLPSRSWWTSALLIVPLTAVTQFPIREGFMGSIASLLSGLAIRLFPGMVLLVVTVLLISSLKSTKLSFRIYFGLIGLLAGLNVWSSQDFGIAATVTLFLLPLLIKNDASWKRMFILVPIWSGTLIGFLAYPIFSQILGKEVKYEYFAFFARQFGGGFGAENIRTPGPVLVILPLIVALIAAHTKIIDYSHKLENVPQQRSIYYSGILGFSFSAWSALGFNYFLNRSYASGQLQILFLLVAISLASLIGALLNLQSIEVDRNTSRNRLKIFSKLDSNLVVSMVASLPLASLLLLPNPSIEFNRIDSGSQTPRWPKETVVAAIKDASAGVTWAKANGVSIAFFGASANYVSKETGIESASILNSPFDTLMSQQTINTTCSYLASVNPDYLVLGDEGAAMFRFKDNTLCETYAFAENTQIRPGRFAKKIG